MLQGIGLPPASANATSMQPLSSKSTVPRGRVGVGGFDIFFLEVLEKRLVTFNANGRGQKILRMVYVLCSLQGSSKKT